MIAVDRATGYVQKPEGKVHTLCQNTGFVGTARECRTGRLLRPAWVGLPTATEGLRPEESRILSVLLFPNEKASLFVCDLFQGPSNPSQMKPRHTIRFRLLLSLLALSASLASLYAFEPFPGNKADHLGAALYSVPLGTEKVAVLVPEKPASGKPWILVPSLYNATSAPVAFMSATELALVKRGFHVVALGPGNTFGAPQAIAKWDAVYEAMTATYGLSPKVSLLGLSREGLAIARWAAGHPGKVVCLYMDKAVCDFKSWPGGKLGVGKGSPKDWASLLELYGFSSEADALAYKENPVDLAAKLAKDKVAILYNTGVKDDVVPYAENGAPMEEVYAKLGGTFKLLRQEAEGHHPHGLQDPTPVVDFIHYRTYGVSEPTFRAVSYGPHPKQIMDLWQAASDKPTPLAVHIHGGGWNAGSHIAPGYLEQLLKAGISVASVEYRFIAEAVADGVVPPVKAPLHDAARAIQFLRSKAGEWNLQKDRVGAWGGSAGACTSLWLAFHKDLADSSSADPVARESSRLQCVATSGAQTTLDPAQMKEWTPNSTYGAHAFGIKPLPGEKKTSFEAFLEQREKILPWIAEYSPYALASTDAPPVYMLFGSAPALGQAQRDPTHTANFGVKLQERLKALNVESELVYPGAPDVKHASIHEFLIERLGAH